MGVKNDHETCCVEDVVRSIVHMYVVDSSESLLVFRPCTSDMYELKVGESVVHVVRCRIPTF